MITTLLVALALLAIATAFSYRRRRMQQWTAQNANYVNPQAVNYQQHPGYGSPYMGGQPGYYPDGPQYPPQAYNNNWNPQAGYAPVRHNSHPTVLRFLSDRCLHSPLVLRPAITHRPRGHLQCHTRNKAFDFIVFLELYSLSCREPFSVLYHCTSCMIIVHTTSE